VLVFEKNDEPGALTWDVRGGWPDVCAFATAYPVQSLCIYRRRTGNFRCVGYWSAAGQAASAGLLALARLARGISFYGIPWL